MRIGVTGDDDELERAEGVGARVEIEIGREEPAPEDQAAGADGAPLDPARGGRCALGEA